MFVTVKLLRGYAQPLTYAIPQDWPTLPKPGTLIRVPFQQRTESALVCEQFAELPKNVSFKIRPALSCELVPEDPNFHHFIEQLSRYYALDPLILYRRMRTSINEKPFEQEDSEIEEVIAAPPVTLTDEQKIAVDGITPFIDQPQFQPILIHGVTGSGKTEVYKKLIIQAHTQGKTIMLLLPEVTLAVHFTTLLRAQLPKEIAILGFHSATPISERREIWHHLIHQTPIVVVGVHMPIMLPISNLGLIIIDEEHEVGFQEKKHPRINTKEAALMRAQLYKIPIVLGSATPSISSLYNVTERGWKLFQLTQRFAGAFPKITLVKIDKEQKRRAFWISKELEAAIADRIARQEQAIIFLNRRGYSFFVQCSACSFIFTCKNCSVSLTYHYDNTRVCPTLVCHTLVCHYCSHTQPLPTQCPDCSAPEKDFVKKGLGTQQLVQILQQLFPQARIGRADADCTKNKKLWQSTVQAMREQQLDILVGTQTITKGYHFPKVTLVGIIWAELNLNMPVYNAVETTIQQIIQVAGRAGRASMHSEVIIQSFSEHPVFAYTTESAYLQFYEQEIASRREIGYPPCIRFAEIELRHDNETVIDQESRACVELLCAYAAERNWDIQILGPAQPPVHKVKNINIRRLYVRSTEMSKAITLFNLAQQQNYASSCYFTPNPVNM